MTDLINSILHSPLVVSVGWTLLHSVWEIAIVGIVLGVLLRVLVRSGPRHRYACSLVALVACVAIPVMTFAVMGGAVAAAGG